MHHPTISHHPFLLSPLVNTFVYSRAVSQVDSIRTGLDKCPVYMAKNLLWLKPDKYYIMWKGSHLTSAQSSITGLYSIRYSPLHVINSWYSSLLHCSLLLCSTSINDLAWLLHKIHCGMVNDTMFCNLLHVFHRDLINDTNK